MKLDQDPRKGSKKTAFRSSTLGALTLILFLGVSPLIAGSTRAYAAESGVYKLSPGDRVSIAVLGQPEFSGEHMIDDTGGVTLPVIGALSLQDLTVQEAEKAITDTLTNGHLQRAITSVRVIEPRPVYVIGDVRSPGSYPFRYGISVMGALALAGGFRVAEQIPYSSRSEFLMADERLRVLNANRRALMLRRARLEAQLDGKSQINLPDSPSFSLSSPELDRIRREEQQTLDIQKAGHEQSLQLLREQWPRLDAEMVAVRDQTTAEARQLELIQSHIADYNNLVSSGLTRRFQLIEYQRQEASYKSNLSRLAAELVNLDIKKGEIKMRIQEAENAYKSKIMAELQETRNRLDEIEITLPAAREIREARLQQGGGIALTGKAMNESHTVIIHRTRAGKTESIQADLMSSLAPGDVIELRPTLRDEASAPAASPSTSLALQSESQPQLRSTGVH